ncbi:MAG: PEP-CTERM sorting domain-containing protein [Chthoniobacterales bacterium]
MKKLLTTLAFVALAAAGANASILITQYYEGSSFNKWIEITNVGPDTIDLGAGAYKLSLWSNANTEAYKTDGTPNQTMSLTGSLSSGASFLYSHGSTTLPSYATATSTNSSVINFNGDDSLTLWSGATFTTASVLDAIGFTDAGNEGTDTSFVRASVDAGWNTTAGSTALDFPDVWTEVTIATVDGATAGTDNYLGYSSLVIPEPSSALLLGAGAAFVVIRRRKTLKK